MDRFSLDYRLHHEFDAAFLQTYKKVAENKTPQQSKAKSHLHASLNFESPLKTFKTRKINTSHKRRVNNDNIEHYDFARSIEAQQQNPQPKANNFMFQYDD